MNGALDVNSKGTMTAILNTDGVSILRLTADITTGTLSTDTNTTGSVTPNSFAFTDDNDRNTLFAVSENDGVTPVALQCDSSGALLVKFI